MREDIDMSEDGFFVCLDHEDLMNLVTCCSPANDKRKLYIEKGYATYTGEFDDEFMWKNHVISNLDDEDLYHMYMCMKYNKPLSFNPNQRTK